MEPRNYALYSTSIEIVHPYLIDADFVFSPIPGALETITRLRNRYAQLTANIAHYEHEVAAQTSELQHINQPKTYDNDYNYAAAEYEEEEVTPYRSKSPFATSTSSVHMTAEDMQHEEDEIHALERKRKALEERVSGMEKDIGGLTR